jgi:hypothetical protein
MPYSDPQRRLEAMRRYAQTPQGKAAKARPHARYVARRSGKKSPKWRLNPAPLEQAINHWSRT